ncbi:MAG: HAD family hydrolase [Candidatus Nanoarchaeia archaeon]
MEKPIIATTLKGLFVAGEAWDEAHEIWYKDASEKLNDLSVMNWIGRDDYFKGVDDVMKRLYPNLLEDERTKLARKMYFDSTIKFIEQNPNLKKQQVINYFKSLKDKFQIALVTTNTQEAVDKIIQAADIKDLFDITESSLPTEKDDKVAVFNRFVEKHGKPILYIGSGKKDSYNFCKEKNIPCVFANLENQEDIKGVESVHNLEELKAKIESL